MLTYTYRDRGCWADGTFGDLHVTRRTIGLALHTMEENPNRWGKDEYAYLSEAMSPYDDRLREEALPKALEVLNAHCKGVYFTFHEGDLMLLKEGEEV